MSKKVLNVDIVKGIAIILVMIGHSGMFLFVKDKVLLNTFIYSFHMPLFFIVAGFFMKDKVNLKKTIKRLLIPFLIASVFWVFIASLLVQLPTYFRSQELYPYSYDFMLQLKKFLKAIFFATRLDIVGTGLWFLVALFMSRILWYILHDLIKFKVTLWYILIVFVVNYLLYNYLNLAETHFYWMWPQSILAYLFMLIGNYYYKNNYVEKTSYLDVIILSGLTIFVIIWNGRIDMSSFKFNNYLGFIFIAIMAFAVIYKFSFVIEKHSKLLKMFLLWCGKQSLNIFLVHPFLLAIVPYILMANCNIKDVYSKPEYLILIYVMIFLVVYLYERLKAFVFNKNTLTKKVIK